MGTEPVGRGITTIFFKHISHQSCQRAVEQTMASCCIRGVCRKQPMLNRSECQGSDPFIKQVRNGERAHIKHRMGGNLLYNCVHVMLGIADRCRMVVTEEKLTSLYLKHFNCRLVRATRCSCLSVTEWNSFDIFLYFLMS